MEEEEEDPWLQNLECPFTWNLTPDKHGLRSFEQEILSKKEKYKQEGAECAWFLIIMDLILCYEESKGGKMEVADDYLNQCDERLNANPQPCSFICVHHDALRHIVLSSRYCLTRDASILTRLARFSDAPVKTQAGVHGVRGVVCMQYGLRGNLEAQEHLTEVLKMDPNTAVWHFLLGQCLGRLRNILGEKKDFLRMSHELDCLERSVQLSPDSAYYVLFLAQALQTLAKIYGTLRIKPRHEVVKMEERSKGMFEQALKLRAECPYTLARCGHAFMKFGDRDRAYELIQKAFKLSPENTMINHRWGQINSQIGDLAVAKKHLRFAAEGGAYWAGMDLLKLLTNENRKYDPTEVLESMRSMFEVDPHRSDLELQIAMCHFHIKQDYAGAIQMVLDLVAGQADEEQQLRILTHNDSCLAWLPNRYHTFVENVREEARTNPALELDPTYRRFMEYLENKFPKLLEDRRRNETRSSTTSWRRPPSSVSPNYRSRAGSSVSVRPHSPANDRPGSSASFKPSWRTTTNGSCRPALTSGSSMELRPDCKRAPRSQSSTSTEKADDTVTGSTEHLRSKSHGERERPRLDRNYMERFVSGYMRSNVKPSGQLPVADADPEADMDPKGNAHPITDKYPANDDPKNDIFQLKDAATKESTPSRRDRYFSYEQRYNLDPSEPTTHYSESRLKMDSRFLKERLPHMLDNSPHGEKGDTLEFKKMLTPVRENDGVPPGFHVPLPPPGFHVSQTPARANGEAPPGFHVPLPPAQANGEVPPGFHVPLTPAQANGEVPPGFIAPLTPEKIKELFKVSPEPVPEVVHSNNTTVKSPSSLFPYPFPVPEELPVISSVWPVVPSVPPGFQELPVNELPLGPRVSLQLIIAYQNVGAEFNTGSYSNLSVEQPLDRDNNNNKNNISVENKSRGASGDHEHTNVFWPEWRINRRLANGSGDLANVSVVRANGSGDSAIGSGYSSIDPDGIRHEKFRDWYLKGVVYLGEGSFDDI